MKRFAASLRNALAGLLFIVASERNMRLHLVLAAAALAAALYGRFTPLELAILSLTVFLVLVMEALNTALEKALDLFTTDYHPRIKLVKNIAAAAVLLAAINALIVALALFGPRLKLLF